MAIFLLIVAVLIALVIIGKQKGNKPLSPIDELKIMQLTDKGGIELLNIIKRLDTGEAYASWMIGSCYESGEILTPKGKEIFPKSKAKALWWQLKSAEDGCDMAQYEISRMYYFGDGLTDNLVERDYGESLKWLNRAAEQGYFFSFEPLGEHYYQGHGVTQD